MLQDEGDVRTSLRKTGGVSHLRRKHLQIKAPAVVGEAGDIATDQGIGAEIRACRKAVEGIFVPVQLHAHAPHQRIARKAVELRTDVVDAEVGEGDDRVGPSALLCGRLDPGNLVLEAVLGPIGLNIDRANDAQI